MKKKKLMLFAKKSKFLKRALKNSYQPYFEL